MIDAPSKFQFDQTSHDTLESLYAHLKRFRVSRERYFHEYYPRHDKATGELIPFKDYEQYQSQNFVSKVTLKKWIKDNPEEGWKWAKEWLAQRKAEKNLIYAPSQVELRTLSCPSMPYYDKIGAAEGGYYGVTTDLGYAPRFNGAPLVFTPLPVGATILCDTREQAPLKLNWPTRAAALNVGDYALDTPHDRGVRIERKSLSDFCGTLSGRKVVRESKRNGTVEDSAFQRFDRELERAQKLDYYVVMMVESNINDAQRFDFLPQTQWLKASPSYIFRQLRELLIKYPLHFQCVFVDGRAEMASKVLRVFELGTSVRYIDLQYAYEEGRL